MERPITRIPPAGPVGAYKTYQIAAPPTTHFRDATCDETQCQSHQFGWISRIDEATPLGMEQAHYIRNLSGRHYTEVIENGITEFAFGAGQTCFARHQIRLDRDEIFAVRGGDWRGNPRGDVRIHDTPDNWVEDFAGHQDRIDRSLNG